MRDIFGFTLVGVQLLLLFPLIRHTVRSKSGEGVALAGEAMWTVLGLGWLAYALAVHSTPIVCSGFLAFAGSGLLTVLLWRPLPEECTTALATLLGTAVVLLVSYALWAVAGLALSLSLLGVVQFVPQLAKSLRDVTTRTRPRGVSPVGSFGRAAYTFAWALYAFAWSLFAAHTQVDWPLVVWGIAGCFAFTLQGMATVIGAMEELEERPAY